MSKPQFIFKVPVAGDGAVGKTSLIVRYTQGTFTDTYKMTIGTSFAVKTVDLDQVMVKLQIWDLAGQPHFGGVRPLFYQGSTGVIYVFSVIDRASFDHLAGWLEEAQKNAGNVPGILIGNKTDLPDQRVVSREEAEAFATQMGLRYIETSAKKDENVGDAFRQVAVTIMQTKPEYGVKADAPEPAEPEAPAPEPVAAQPVELQPSEDEMSVEPIVSEAAPEFIEPDPEPIPLIVDEPEPVVLEQPAPEPVVSEPEEVVPVEPPPVEEPAPVVIASPEPAESAPEDIVVETKASSSLVEFVGVDPQSLSSDDFEKRSVHAMQRLGVSEVGVLGTFLRSLIRQGQRDVVIESLESLQEDR